jgi:putative drug exporter of the RND superfamily
MEIGLGMAAAIFVEAYIIRTVFVPAAMHMLGRSNWWLPAWLDRALPRLHLEPAQPRARTQSCALPPCPRTVQPAPSRIPMALSRG